MCPPAAEHRLSHRQRAALAAPHGTPSHAQDMGTRTQSNPPKNPEKPPRRQQLGSRGAASLGPAVASACAPTHTACHGTSHPGAPQALGWGRGAVLGAAAVLRPGSAAGCQEGPWALPIGEKTVRGFWGQQERRAGREERAGGRCWLMPIAAGGGSEALKSPHPAPRWSQGKPPVCEGTAGSRLLPHIQRLLHFS